MYYGKILISKIWKKEPGLIYVKFGVTSQTGAHSPLGYDEIAYKVASRGNQELAGYEYLKNYEVPEKFQKNIIKSFECVEMKHGN